MPFVKVPIESRFWKKVHKTSSCWNWTGHVTLVGYGLFNFSKLMGAHRASWIIHNGPIPDGAWVLHECDNRRCVNPKHLFLGTAKDNRTDMEKKGRVVQKRGESLPQSRLTEQKVRLIRELYESGLFRYEDIAERFGVNPVTIGDIIRGTTWTHVD